MLKFEIPAIPVKERLAPEPFDDLGLKMGEFRHKNTYFPPLLSLVS